MSTIIPRIRGRAIEKGKGWGYEIHVNIGTLDPLIVEAKDTFISKEAAIEHMQEMALKILHDTCDIMGLPEPEGVYNLKDGVKQTLTEFRQAHKGRRR